MVEEVGTRASCPLPREAIRRAGGSEGEFSSQGEEVDKLEEVRREGQIRRITSTGSMMETGLITG